MVILLLADCPVLFSNNSPASFIPFPFSRSKNSSESPLLLRGFPTQSFYPRCSFLQAYFSARYSFFCIFLLLFATSQYCLARGGYARNATRNPPLSNSGILSLSLSKSLRFLIALSRKTRSGVVNDILSPPNRGWPFPDIQSLSR